MNRLILVAGVLVALSTGGLLIAYPFAGEAVRGWVLYYAVCSLGVTVAVMGLLVSQALEAVIRHVRRMEQLLRGRKSEPGGDPPPAPP